MQMQMTLEQSRLLFAYEKLREYFGFPDTKPTDADVIFSEKLLSIHSLETVMACLRGLVLSHKYPIGNFKPQVCARLSLLSERHHIVEVSADRWNYYYSDKDSFLKSFKKNTEEKH